jgi:hypothetical protein
MSVTSVEGEGFQVSTPIHFNTPFRSRFTKMTGFYSKKNFLRRSIPHYEIFLMFILLKLSIFT